MRIATIAVGALALASSAAAQDAAIEPTVFDRFVEPKPIGPP